MRIFIAFVLCLSLSTTFGWTYRVKRQRPSSACSINQFRCNNNDCIESFLVCNGGKDCADGSDETEGQCAKLTCPSYLLKCKYGACVHRNLRCNGIEECADGSDEDGCPLSIPFSNVSDKSPTEALETINDGCLTLKHPMNGKRFFINNKLYVENAPVTQSTSIKIICDPGYRATDLQFDGEAYCFQGKWIGDTSADICKKTCPPLNDPTYKATCIYSSRPVTCAEAVEGTKATTECKPFFSYGTRRPKMTCKNGRWTPILGSCTPECGIKKVNAQGLVIGGTTATTGEYPWIVAIYNKGNISGVSEHICGGSIISRKHVLSAAHCFTNVDTGVNYNKDNFIVVAGKYFRDFKDQRDEPTAQLRNIEQLDIHPYYRGRLLNYQHDIAVLQVREFTIDLYVQPVCIDWTREYEETSLQEGNKGVIAGWELYTQDDDSDKGLKKVILPLQSKQKCREHLPDNFFQMYYTPDKICAVYINNDTKSCRRSSGVGYYFQSNSRFYIRGIVSLAPVDGRCARHLYALHTKVSVYTDWLANVTGKYI